MFYQYGSTTNNTNCWHNNDNHVNANHSDVERLESKLDALAELVLLSHRGQSASAKLENCTQVCDSMLMKGAYDMHHRQRITIDGVTKWRTFDSIQELVDIVVAEVKQSCAHPSCDILFKDYMADWYAKFKEPQLNFNTRDGYESMMRKHINPVIGDKRISDITVSDVQTIMNRLKSASRAKQVKSIINLVMDAAISDELYRHPNPTKDRRIIMPTARKKREAVDNDDLGAIRNILPDMPANLACLLAMLIMTGCRRGEALGARWEDIDWEANTIHLQRVVRFHHNRPDVSSKMKSKAANRKLSLWPDLIPYLGERKASGFIINTDGEPLTETQYRNRWKAIDKRLKEIGIEHFTAHQLRHSYATNAANSGKVPPKVLQGMLGHANYDTTMNVYAGFSDDRILECSLNLGDEYSRLTGKSCTEIATNDAANPPAPQAI